jgi:ribonuclease HI
VRDDCGRVLVALSQTVLDYFTASLAEARAALLAVQICKEVGFNRVLFEGDAKLVISAINSTEPDWSNVGVIIANIKEELLGLQQWQMSFVRREGNGAAHVLSKLATANIRNDCWFAEQTECISEIVTN